MDGPSRLATSPDKIALRRIGLVYVSDTEPGIRRERRGRGFCYRLPDGALVRDRQTLDRIRSLGLPPAYEKVWICIRENGHLQATGFDVRGRKQYRYHDGWQEWRSEQKFGELASFADALPRIRRRVAADLDRSSDDAVFLLAGVVALLDETHLRIGNRAYTRDNGSYGATTLLKRHLSFGGDGIRLSFVAKGGKRVRRQLRHPRLQKILEVIADLPGRELFSWRDAEGEMRRIDSGRLNAYLGQIAGCPISAKTFRTWGGSVAAFALAAKELRRGACPSIKALCAAASDALHNTPAICRTSYVHPAVLELATDEDRRAIVQSLLSKKVNRSGLKADEARLQAYLQNV